MGNYSDISASHGFSPSKFIDENGVEYVFSHYISSGCAVYIQASIMELDTEESAEDSDEGIPSFWDKVKGWLIK